LYRECKYLKEGLCRKWIFVLTAVALMIATHQSGAAPELAGRAGIVTGTVSVESAGGRRTLEAGDSVFVGDRLITAQGSSAEVVFVDEGRMKLAADSDLEITGYSYGPDEKTRQGLISLAYGRVRFAAGDLEQFGEKRFRVLTRTAVVVSSGDADFIVSLDRERARDEVCRDGLVSALCLGNSVVVIGLEFPGNPAVLSSQMISRVCGPNMPAPPRFATPAELSGILADLDRIGNTRTTPMRYSWP
jgi:hypothetical protein